MLESLTGDAMPWQLEAIAAGRFEQTTCGRCHGEFQPEHCLLLTRLSTGLWLVMHPPEDREHFATLEREVAGLLATQFAAAPPLLASRLRGARARLVFGQAMLAEAVRAELASIEPALLECAKLDLPPGTRAELSAWGPAELCFEQVLPGGALRCGVLALRSSARLGEMVLPSDALPRARAALPEWAARCPELFDLPYVSASRYLHPAPPR